MNRPSQEQVREALEWAAATARDKARAARGNYAPDQERWFYGLGEVLESALAAQAAEIERLMDTISELQYEMDGLRKESARAENRGFRKAAEWLQLVGYSKVIRRVGSLPPIESDGQSWFAAALDTLRAEADRREGK